MIEVRTKSRECLLDITGEVASAVAKGDCDDGFCVVFVQHTTAAITINENADPDVARDMIAFLNKMVPRNWGFAHSEGNSDAHIKASLLGSSVMVPFVGKKLRLGTWQGIYLAEFDGPRTRKCHLTVIGK